MTDDERRFRLLADYVDGLLDGPGHSAARSEVERLLAADPDAVADERWLRGFVATARAVELVEPSPLLHQRLDQHFGRWAAAQDVLNAPVARVRMTIYQDSRHDDLVGVRGETATVSLGYECELGDLALDLFPAGEGVVRLLGQVLLSEETGTPYFEATVVQGGTVRRAESDELGRFGFDALPVGLAELRVGNGEVELDATVDLRPDSPRSH